jgi:hypothetical protein
MLAVCSSNSDDVIDFLNNEKYPKDGADFNPLYLLTDVVPPLLALHGNALALTFHHDHVNHMYDRVPIPASPKSDICE